jgi:hypothetical protein
LFISGLKPVTIGVWIVFERRNNRYFGVFGHFHNSDICQLQHLFEFFHQSLVYRTLHAGAAGGGQRWLCQQAAGGLVADHALEVLYLPVQPWIIGAAAGWQKQFFSRTGAVLRPALEVLFTVLG